MEKEKQDKTFLEAQIYDGIQWVSKTNKKKFTQFLDPAQQQICKNIIKNRKDIQYEIFGGHEHCERKMTAIIPRNDDISIWEWPISVFHLRPKYAHKTLKHAEILGTLMSLGVKRETIGDINIIENIIQIFIIEELKDYLLYNLDKISNVSIEIKEVVWDEVIPHQEPFDELYITAASMRLDGIISKIFGLSRKDSSSFIQSGKVKVNWEINTNTSNLLDTKDVISVRGKGRAIIQDILGNTKKGNKKILIHKNK